MSCHSIAEQCARFHQYTANTFTTPSPPLQRSEQHVTLELLATTVDEGMTGNDACRVVYGCLCSIGGHVLRDNVRQYSSVHWFTQSHRRRNRGDGLAPIRLTDEQLLTQHGHEMRSLRQRCTNVTGQRGERWHGVVGDRSWRCPGGSSWQGDCSFSD